MSEYKIQSHKDLREEMKTVARGEKPAPADAAKASFEFGGSAASIADAGE